MVDALSSSGPGLRAAPRRIRSHDLHRLGIIPGAPNSFPVSFQTVSKRTKKIRILIAPEINGISRQLAIFCVQSSHVRSACRRPKNLIFQQQRFIDARQFGYLARGLSKLFPEFVGFFSLQFQHVACGIPSFATGCAELHADFFGDRRIVVVDQRWRNPCFPCHGRDTQLGCCGVRPAALDPIYGQPQFFFPSRCRLTLLAHKFSRSGSWPNVISTFLQRSISRRTRARPPSPISSRASISRRSS